MSARREGEIEGLIARAGSRGHDALVAGVLAGGRSTIHAWRREGPRPDGGGALRDRLADEARHRRPARGHVPGRGGASRRSDLEVPTGRARAPLARACEPTLEELATHRADLPNAPRGIGRKELAYALGLRSSDPWADIDARAYREAVRRTAARRPPGGRVRYSSLGFGLLGDALAARAGATYERLLEERITSPLGLLDTTISVPPEHRQRLLEGRSRRGHPRPPLRDQMPAGGAIRSSAREIVRLLACFLERPERAPGPALGLAAEPRARIGRRMDIGLGWMILRRRGCPQLIWHNGGTWGFRSFAAMIPDRQVAVVVLANTARSVDRLGIKLVDLLAGDGRTA